MVLISLSSAIRVHVCMDINNVITAFKVVRLESYLMIFSVLIIWPYLASPHQTAAACSEEPQQKTTAC